MIRRLRAAGRRLAASLRHRRHDRDLAEELASHLQLHIDDNVRRGMPPDEARRDAMIRLGGIAQTAERVRDRRGYAFLDAIGRDLRYALRVLVRARGFSVAVVATIALGTGANAAIFSLVESVLIETLPVARPQELVAITSVAPSGENFSFSYPMYRDLRDANEVFAGVIARGGAQINVSADGVNERVHAELVSGNYFDVLGVHAAAGRLLTPDDDRDPRAHPVVVLSHGYWQRRFHGDESIVGRTLLLNGTPMTVVGVSAPGFYGGDLATAIDLQIPLMETPIFNPVPPTRLESRRHQWLTLMARRRPGIAIEQAQASVQQLAREIWRREADDLPASAADARQDRLGRRLLLSPGAQGRATVQRQLRTPLLLLLAVTAIVLLIVCTNVANLLLARAAAREGELVMRVALGASRWRLFQQTVTEAMVLSLAGAAAGVLVAVWGRRGLLALMPAPVRPNLDAALHWRTFAVLSGVAVLFGIVLGLAPALHVGRADVAPAIKRQQATVTGGRRVAVGGALVVVQIALAVPLLVMAALLMQTLAHLRQVDLGFNREHVLLASLNPSLNGYPPERAQAFYAALLDDVRGLPAVTSAALASDSPISGGWDQLSIVVEGYTPRPGEDTNPMAAMVSPGYFGTLGIPLVAGRDFTPRDAAGAPRVAIVNQALARYYFGSQNALGRHLGTDRVADTTIVGVVADAKYVQLREETRRHFYLPVAQQPRLFDLTLQVRTRGTEGDAVAAIRAAMERLDPHIPLYNVTSLARQVDESILRERLTTWLCAAFGVLATFLAALGLYGVVAFATARRSREIGLRIALGAGRRRILLTVTRQTFTWIGVGLMLGTAAAFVASRVVGGLLYGVDAVDLRSFIAALAVLVAAAAAAAYVPAARATRVDPMRALRCE